MKRYRHLFEQVCSLDNLHLAYLKARRGKQGRRSVNLFTFHLERELISLRDELLNGTYIPGAYRQFTVYESKRRLISAAPFRDRVLHHAICNILEPIFEKTFIYDSYACRLGKGQHSALRRLREFLRNNKYVLKGDIARYFPSIDHEILLNLLARKICDDKLLDLLSLIISQSPRELDVPIWCSGDDLFAQLRPHGLPIGNQTSQFFANIYLNPFDHFVKEELREKCYLRYVDDFVILSNDKSHLHEIKEKARQFLEGLRLKLHYNKTQVSPAKDGIDWLGYRVFPTHVKVRKSNVHLFKRRLKRMMLSYSRGELNAEDVRIRIQSWLAHASHADSYNLRSYLMATTFFVREG